MDFAEATPTSCKERGILLVQLSWQKCLKSRRQNTAKAVAGLAGPRGGQQQVCEDSSQRAPVFRDLAIAFWHESWIEGTFPAGFLGTSNYFLCTAHLFLELPQPISLEMHLMAAERSSQVKSPCAMVTTLSNHPSLQDSHLLSWLNLCLNYVHLLPFRMMCS